eukprot:NODE_643_length_5058_cov_0.251664.p1 type:complete len:398 gc:universal NODE_643_length_5058_cov_0.251664:3315-2122(-)
MDALHFQIMDYSTYPIAKDCKVTTNGVFTTYNNKELVLFNCIHENDYSVLMYYNGKMKSLNIKDSEAYLSMNRTINEYELHGPMHPHVFSFKNELYLYYSMTNPQNKENPFRSMEMMTIKDVLDGSSHRSFINTKIFDKKPLFIEENWAFFETNQEMRAIYSLKPFIIGKMENNQLFKSTSESHYDCMTQFKYELQITSNAMKYKSEKTQKEEYMVFFNAYQSDNSSNSDYNTYIGYFNAAEPHHLLRITQNAFDVGIPGKSIHYSGVYLNGDILKISGGVDQKIFKIEMELKQIMNLQTSPCLKQESNQEDVKTQPKEERKEVTDEGLLKTDNQLVSDGIYDRDTLLANNRATIHDKSSHMTYGFLMFCIMAFIVFKGFKIIRKESKHAADYSKLA